MATIFLNGVLASTELNATVVGGTTPDQIASTGALEAGLVKGAQNTDFLNFDLIGQNISAETVINGNQGDDTIIFDNTFNAVDSTFRNSTVFGGSGDDSIDIDEVKLGLGSYVRGNEGTDDITFNWAEGAWINGNQGNDTISVLSDYSGIAATSVNGGNGDDSIDVGSVGTTEVVGGWVRGDDGTDTISILATANMDSVLVNGNAGDDSIIAVVVTANDFVDNTLRGGDGDDTVNAAAIAGAGNALTILGDDGDDVLLSGQLADSVEGGAGEDFINGNLGDDTLTGGEATDTFDYDQVAFTSADADTITDFVTGADGDVFNVNGAVAGGIVTALTASVVNIAASADNSFIVDSANTGYASFAAAEAAVQAANAATLDYVLIFRNTTTGNIEAWADADSSAAGAGVQLIDSFDTANAGNFLTLFGNDNVGIA